MANQQLIDYIKQQLQLGKNQEEIKTILLAKGWNETDVMEAFNLVAGRIASPPIPPSPAAPSYTTPSGSLPGATALLGETWGLYKQRLKTLFTIAIIPQLMIFAFAGLLVIMGITTAALLVGKLQTMAGGIVIVSILLGILFFFALLVVQLWSQVALVYALKDSEDIGSKEAYRRARPKIFSFWWISILTGIIVGAGFLFFFIPGFIFSIWFTFAIYVLIAEDIKGMDALLKSREYVRGHFGSVFGRLLFLMIVLFGVFILYFLASLLLSFVPIFGQIVGFLFTALLTPFVIAYYFLLYRQLKAVKGEFAFTPSAKTKTIFSLVIIAGVIISVVLMIVSTVVVSNLIKKQGEQEKKLEALEEAATDYWREFDINEIARYLALYADNHGVFPDSLERLVPDYFYSIPVDRKTNQPYKYQLKDEGKDFEVCAILSNGSEKCVNAKDIYYPPLPSPFPSSPAF
ncbi:MAG: hypothetical protein COT34_01965 [Candidatus Nealsonbacteria bacterium CG08_land_8_20_14_0_20_43_11]|uniref:Type II secretion system protein GspG C-terminal domain-containing protein n=1 Tax=Candidatus Nealsonbacteria bacterium CG08_land_8_20_14_0_20_43_11 TaxID=1974706 RepID=A0A2M6T0W2_9BACT|nr:MAG: hypothetical protein COT34_01965 [Candidatus Nealsonbacteria bacterium CG08_land_8_20_14_0_20_43_11]